MTPNVGNIDRLLRVIAGLALLSMTVLLDGDMRWWGLVGVVPLATGLFSFCPLYTLLGIKTCRT